MLAIQLPDRVVRILAVGSARGGDEVDVRVDETGQGREAGAIDGPSVGRPDRGLVRFADGGDAAVADQQVDPLARRSRGPIEEPDAADDEVLRGAALRRREDAEQERCDQGAGPADEPCHVGGAGLPLRALEGQRPPSDGGALDSLGVAAEARAGSRRRRTLADER